MLVRFGWRIEGPAVSDDVGQPYRALDPRTGISNDKHHYKFSIA